MAKCGICWDEHSSFYSLPCHHKFCGDCLKHHLSLAAAEADLSRLACPDSECRMSLATPVHLPMIQDIAGKDACDKIHAALNAQLLQSSDFYACPKCGLKGFAPQNERGRPVTCSGCKFEFCSRCRSDRYHYNLSTDGRDCSEVMREKEAAWLTFCSDTLGKILQEQAQKDAANKELLKAYKKKEKEQKAVLEAFEQDERAKANWVHCPHCNALWNGSDACSHVTCGVLEAAMGSRRGVVGCGKKFDLHCARRYTPAQAPNLEKLVKPEAADDQASHNVSCNKCNAQIRGIRLRCLNCPNYNLCTPCLAKKGQNHPAERRWPKKPHVFDIIARPKGEPDKSDVTQDLQNLGVDIDALGNDESFDLALALSLSLADQHFPTTVNTPGSSSSRPVEVVRPPKRPRISV